MPKDNGEQSNTAAGSEGLREAAPILRREAEIEPCKCKRCEQPYFSKKTKDFISVFTLIAVSVYTGVSILLWCNSNKQLTVSQDAEIHQLRAYLYVRRFPITVSQTTATANVEINHAGVTPAYNVRLDANIEVIQYLVGKLNLDDVTSPNVSHILKSQYSILYSTEHIPETISMPPYATEAMKLALAPNPNYRFYIYGVVRYLDIFGLDKLQPERRYEFCFIYKPQTGDIGTERGCEDYNKPG